MENILESRVTDDIVTSYFNMGFGAYMSNLTACICITALLMAVCRKIFKNKFRNSWTYALWIVMPLIMLVPLKIATPLTFIPLFNFNIALKIDPIEPKLIEGVTEISSFSTIQSTTGLSLYTVLKWIWLAVLAVLVIVEIVRYKLLERDIKKNGIPCSSESYKAVLEGICSELKIKTPELICWKSSDTPFAMGIIKPRIILPSEDYSEQEASFILRHEAVHIKRHDIIIKLGLTLFRCVNWFNPIAYILCRQAFEDMEITCDEKAVESFSEEQRGDYSSAILRGVSRKKYTAVTTYLSSNAKSLKKRISAVMCVKKLSGVIPFVMAFVVINLCSAVVYAYPDDTDSYYIYTVPFPMEADPYVTTEEWKTCTAYYAEEAAEQIFSQYMDMYMGEDVPEYYRIEDYHIIDINEVETGIFNAQKGLFNDNVFMEISYNARYANECGNNVHNRYFAMPRYVNGLAESSFMCFELDRKGEVWTLENYGAAGHYDFGDYHFSNSLTGRYGTLTEVQFMAESGLLDYSWDTERCLPEADDYIMWKYLRSKAHGNNDPVISPDDYGPLGSDLTDTDFISEVQNSEYIYFSDMEMKIINVDKHDFNEVKAVYCGFDYNVVSNSKRIYFNITGEKECGVIITMENVISESAMFSFSQLTSVTVTQELFEPYEFADSFLTADLPAGLTEYATAENAKAILEYMKTPRDGSDFTVLDYRNITVKDDGIYAEVKFKGRLEGIYSADIINAVKSYEKHAENPAYGVDISGTVPEEAYKTGYMTVCIVK